MLLEYLVTVMQPSFVKITSKVHIEVAGPASDNTKVTVYVPGVLKAAGLDTTQLKGVLGSEALQLVVVCINAGETSDPLESTVDIEKDKPSYIPK